MKIEIFPGRNLVGERRWYFHILGGNGEIMAPSESYVRKIDCVKSAEKLKAELQFADIVVLDGEKK